MFLIVGLSDHNKKSKNILINKKKDYDNISISRK